MRNFAAVLLLTLALGACAAAQVSGGSRSGGTVTWGGPGPPNYGWARGDTYVSQRTSSPVPSDAHFPTPTAWQCGAAAGLYGAPVMPAANSSYCDPQYNGAVVTRMTDGVTASQTLLGLAPNHNPGNSLTCAPAASCPPSMNTAQSGSDQQYFINANDTLLTINTVGGVSSTLPISLNTASDPPSVQVLPVGGVVGKTLVGWAQGSNTWDHHLPYLQYFIADGTALGGCPANSTAICQMSFAQTGGLYATAPTVTSLLDPAQTGCLGAGFAATWSSEFQASDDGTKFALGYSNSGGQGSPGAHYVALYDKTSNSCATLDIEGPNCTIASCPYIPSPSVTGGAGWPYYTGPLLGDLARMACSLHNVNTTPNNAGYAHVSCSTPGNWSWQIQVGGVAGAYKGTWSGGATYGQGDEVWYSAGAGLQWYISLAGSNSGNVPSSSPAKWQPGTWTPSTSYPKNAVVFDGTAAAVGGGCSTAYVALSAVSGAVNPCADPADWALLPYVAEGSWWVSPYSDPAGGHLVYSFQAGTLDGPLFGNKSGGHNSQGFTHLWNSTGAQYSAVRNYIAPNYGTAGAIPVTAAAVPISDNALEALCTVHCGGAWSAGTTYSQYDVATVGSSRYISTQGANAGNAPTGNPNAWWALEAEFSGHTSANAMDPNDQNMVLESTVYTRGDTFPSYGYAEILGLQCATNDVGSGPVTNNCTQGGWRRFAPTWTEARDTNFNNAEAIGGEDPLGQLFCWSTTMLDTLGTDHSGNPRGDVFCVILGARYH